MQNIRNIMKSGKGVFGANSLSYFNSVYYRTAYTLIQKSFYSSLEENFYGN